MMPLIGKVMQQRYISMHCLDMDFTRSEDNAINAALNYGYGILLSCFNQEIVANGYMTQIGLIS